MRAGAIVGLCLLGATAPGRCAEPGLEAIVPSFRADIEPLQSYCQSVCESSGLKLVLELGPGMRSNSRHKIELENTAVGQLLEKLKEHTLAPIAWECEGGVLAVYQAPQEKGAPRLTKKKLGIRSFGKARPMEILRQAVELAGIDGFDFSELGTAGGRPAKAPPRISLRRRDWTIADILREFHRQGVLSIDGGEIDDVLERMDDPYGGGLDWHHEGSQLVGHVGKSFPRGLPARPIGRKAFANAKPSEVLAWAAEQLNADFLGQRGEALPDILDDTVLLTIPARTWSLRALLGEMLRQGVADLVFVSMPEFQSKDLDRARVWLFFARVERAQELPGSPELGEPRGRPPADDKATAARAVPAVSERQAKVANPKLREPAVAGGRSFWPWAVACFAGALATGFTLFLLARHRHDGPA